jgi:hypothetical protein
MGFELRGGWGVKVNETIEAMRDQWKSMSSMAGMFLMTIFLGITIQPVWDEDEVRAFITPMISTLSIMTLAESGNDIEVLGLGISIIALNLGLYIAAPAAVGFTISKKIKSRK